MCGGFNDKLTALNYDLMMRFYIPIIFFIFGFGFSYGQSDEFSELLDRAKRRDVDAAFALARLYESMPETPENIKDAQKWYRHAYYGNHPLLDYLVGLSLYKNKRIKVPAFLGDGRIKEKGYEYTKQLHFPFPRASERTLNGIAMDHWRRAAKNHHVVSQYTLGAIHERGIKGTPQNYETAIKWYTQAAENGSVDAQNNLGLMYQEGRGVAKDNKAAVIWYSQAVEQGDPISQYNLALMYANGEGVVENDTTAFILMEKSAKQGLASAQNDLAEMFYSGDGVAADNVKGYLWFNLAAFNGAEDAAKNKEIISKRMTKEQIAKAQELSEQCLANSYKDC